MPTESPNSLSAPPRRRWAFALSAVLAAVVLLVLVYRLSAPKNTQTTTASGERIPESDVLQVGALPVT